MYLIKFQRLSILYTNNIWVLKTLFKEYRYLPDEDKPIQFFLPWLPVLENEPKYFFKQIEEVTSIDVQGFCSIFPLNKLLLLGLISNSLLWVSKAIVWMEWLDELRVHFDFREHLEEMLDSSCLKKNKQLRDKIRKIIKKSGQSYREL